MLNHDRPNWAPLLIIQKRHKTMTKIFIELPLELGCVTCTGIIGTCNCLEVSVSHEDSAISHPHDQDYLSLRVGKGSEVELQQALAIWWLTYANESEKRSNAWSRSKKDQEVILKLLTFKHNTRTVFTSRTPPERDHHGYTRS